MIRILIFLCLLTVTSTYSQSDIYSQLKNGPTSISFISFSENKPFTENDPVFSNKFQKLIKCGSELYAFMDGTGRLYNYHKYGKLPNWQRIDSTTHFGYNIAAFPFTYRDKIYNLGGYGIWRINGQLREFNTNEHTWDIVKLNKEIPLLFDERSNLLWYDHGKGNIYLGYSMIRNEAVKTSEIDETVLEFTVRKLDLGTKTWNDLGTLSDPLKGKIQSLLTLTMSPWGQLVTLGDKINLIDYVNNKLLLLSTNKVEYQTIVRNKFGNYLFFKDSTLFIINPKSSSSDSIKLSYKDFIPTDIPVYVPAKTRNTFQGYLITLLICIVILIILIRLFTRRFKIKLEKNVQKIESEVITLHQPIDKKIFDGQEITLISIILSNTEKSHLTSIEEINTTLGLTKRSFEIQKKQRSDIITNINQKFGFLFPQAAPLIIKQRSSMDRRSFDYSISKENIDKIKPLIKA